VPWSRLTGIDTLIEQIQRECGVSADLLARTNDAKRLYNGARFDDAYKVTTGILQDAGIYQVHRSILQRFS
jgi:hypothetical protein